MKRKLKLMLFLISLIVLSGCKMNAQEARDYCSKACVDVDKEQYCENKITVDFEGSKWAGVTCQNLEANKKVERCEEVMC